CLICSGPIYVKIKACTTRSCHAERCVPSSVTSKSSRRCPCHQRRPEPGLADASSIVSVHTWREYPGSQSWYVLSVKVRCNVSIYWNLLRQQRTILTAC